MELAARAIEFATRALNSNLFMNVGLVGAFGLLSLRSVHQQSLISALESQKETLRNSNKDGKKTLWEWKQQLYAEASDTETAVVPLSTLKEIYNDATIDNKDAGKGDGKSAPSKILI